MKLHIITTNYPAKGLWLKAMKGEVESDEIVNLITDYSIEGVVSKLKTLYI